MATQVSAACDLAQLLSTARPTLTVVSGPAAGMEYVLDQPRVLIGRGPGVDLVLDESLERVHAALDYDGSIDVASYYEHGKLVRRELTSEQVLEQWQDPRGS